MREAPDSANVSKKVMVFGEKHTGYVGLVLDDVDGGSQEVGWRLVLILVLFFRSGLCVVLVRRIKRVSLIELLCRFQKLRLDRDGVAWFVIYDSLGSSCSVVLLEREVASVDVVQRCTVIDQDGEEIGIGIPRTEIVALWVHGLESTALTGQVVGLAVVQLCKHLVGASSQHGDVGVVTLVERSRVGVLVRAVFWRHKRCGESGNQEKSRQHGG